MLVLMNNKVALYIVSKILNVFINATLTCYIIFFFNFPIVWRLADLSDAVFLKYIAIIDGITHADVGLNAGPEFHNFRKRYVFNHENIDAINQVLIHKFHY